MNKAKTSTLGLVVMKVDAIEKISRFSDGMEASVVILKAIIFIFYH